MPFSGIQGIGGNFNGIQGIDSKSMDTPPKSPLYFWNERKKRKGEEEEENGGMYGLDSPLSTGFISILGLLL